VDESIFLNWFWWLVVGCFLVWWWPKKINAQTFRVTSTVTIESIKIGSIGSQESTAVMPELELVSSNWGFITSTVPETIYQQTIVGEYEMVNGCHSADDLELITPEDPLPCQLETNVLTAIPYPSKLFVFRSGEYVEVRPISEFPSPGELLLTEVMWMGSYNGEISLANDEWIELYNHSSQTLRLEGVQLVGAGIGGQTITIPADYLLPPFTFFIVKKVGVDNSQLARNGDWVTSQLSLSNSDATLRILSLTGEILDQLPTGKWQAGTNDTVNHIRASAQRTFFDLSGNDWSTWTQCQPDICSIIDQKYWKAQSSPQNYGTPWAASVF